MKDLFLEPAPAVELRPYQREMSAAFFAGVDKGLRRMLAVLPTGMGKTVTFASIVDEFTRASAGRTVLVIAHRKELLQQAADTISRMCPHLHVSIDSGDETADRVSDVVVASVQSVGLPTSKRLDWLLPGLVIVDEAHHAAASTYQNTIVRMGVLEDDGAVMLGVTATPHRLDNKALFGRERTIFQELIYQVTLLDAVKGGWLVDLSGFRVASDVDLSSVKTTAGDYNLDQLENVVNTDARNTLAVKSWREACEGAKTIVFCAGVDHAEDVAEAFRIAGVNAESVNGAMPKRQRTAILDRFRSGQTTVLTNMDIATEGFDVPDIHAVMMLRPTKSWSLFTQMIGRGLRPLSGVLDGLDSPADRRAAIRDSAKPKCVVIDIIDNTGRHSLVDTPDGSKGDPSLNGLMGLPEFLEAPAEMTVAEIAEEFFELPEAVQAGAFRRPTRLGDLKARLTAVNMLAELDLPAEAEGAGVRFQWLKMSDFSYVVDLHQGRRASMEQNAIGTWHLKLDGARVSKEYDLGESLIDAFQHAESLIENTFVGLAMVKRDHPWRTAAATSNQVMLLKRLGCPDEILNGLRSRGHASDVITMLQGGR